MPRLESTEGSCGQTCSKEWPVEHLPKKWLWMQARWFRFLQNSLLGLLSAGVWSDHGGQAVVHSAQLRAGQDVVVIGAGGVGSMRSKELNCWGSSYRRFGSNQQKLEIAQEFGATDVVLATDPEPWQLARQALGRGADAVFVTVGAAVAYETAPQYLAPTGKLVMVGMPRSGDFSSYDPGTMASLNQGMIGFQMGNVVIQRDIPWMVISTNKDGSNWMNWFRDAGGWSKSTRQSRIPSLVMLDAT